MRLLWMLGAHDSTQSVEIKKEIDDPKTGDKVLEEEVKVKSESNFNIFLLITTVYLGTFILMFGLSLADE